MERYYYSNAYMKDDRKFTVWINKGEMDQIRQWVLKKDNIETGGDLFGLWIDQHTAVVQFVLGPGQDCRRSSVSFYQDVNYLATAGDYLTKQHGLCNIGQWHSHHRLNLRHPSGGDENTVWGNMPKLGLNRYIVFIATIEGHYYETNTNVNCFLFEVNDNGSQLPVLEGNFSKLAGNSSFRFDKSIRRKIKKGAESVNEITVFEKETKKAIKKRQHENESGKEDNDKTEVKRSREQPQGSLKTSKEVDKNRWVTTKQTPEKKPRHFQVFINEGEMEQIKKWVLMKDNIETGGDLFGLWIDKHTAVVQFVLGPGRNCRRTTASFYQDVDYLEKAGSYLTKKHGLCNIGQWHSHHRMTGLHRPSGGDENTVWSNMPKLGLTRYIVFIATIHEQLQGLRADVNCFLFEMEGGRQLPVLHGTFQLLDGKSPLRLDEPVLERMGDGAESMNDPLVFEVEKKKDEEHREVKKQNSEVTSTIDGSKSMNHPDVFKEEQDGDEKQIQAGKRPCVVMNPSEEEENMNCPKDRGDEQWNAGKRAKLDERGDSEKYETSCSESENLTAEEDEQTKASFGETKQLSKQTLSIEVEDSKERSESGCCPRSEVSNQDTLVDEATNTMLSSTRDSPGRQSGNHLVETKKSAEPIDINNAEEKNGERERNFESGTFGSEDLDGNAIVRNTGCQKILPERADVPVETEAVQSDKNSKTALLLLQKSTKAGEHEATKEMPKNTVHDNMLPVSKPGIEDENHTETAVSGLPKYEKDRQTGLPPEKSNSEEQKLAAVTLEGAVDSTVQEKPNIEDQTKNEKTSRDSVKDVNDLQPKLEPEQNNGEEQDQKLAEAMHHSAVNNSAQKPKPSAENEDNNEDVIIDILKDDNDPHTKLPFEQTSAEEQVNMEEEDNMEEKQQFALEQERCKESNYEAEEVTEEDPLNITAKALTSAVEDVGNNEESGSDFSKDKQDEDTKLPPQQNEGEERQHNEKELIQEVTVNTAQKTKPAIDNEGNNEKPESDLPKDGKDLLTGLLSDKGNGEKLRNVTEPIQKVKVNNTAQETKPAVKDQENSEKVKSDFGENDEDSPQKLASEQGENKENPCKVKEKREGATVTSTARPEAEDEGNNDSKNDLPGDHQDWRTKLPPGQSIKGQQIMRTQILQEETEEAQDDTIKEDGQEFATNVSKTSSIPFVNEPEKDETQRKEQETEQSAKEDVEDAELPYCQSKDELEELYSANEGQVLEFSAESNEANVETQDRENREDKKPAGDLLKNRDHSLGDSATEDRDDKRREDEDDHRGISEDSKTEDEKSDHSVNSGKFFEFKMEKEGQQVVEYEPNNLEDLVENHEGDEQKVIEPVVNKNRATNEPPKDLKNDRDGSATKSREIQCPKEETKKWIEDGGTRKVANGNTKEKRGTQRSENGSRDSAYWEANTPGSVCRYVGEYSKNEHTKSADPVQDKIISTISISQCNERGDSTARRSIFDPLPDESTKCKNEDEKIRQHGASEDNMPAQATGTAQKKVEIKGRESDKYDALASSSETERETKETVADRTKRFSKETETMPEGKEEAQDKKVNEEKNINDEIGRQKAQPKKDEKIAGMRENKKHDKGKEIEVQALKKNTKEKKKTGEKEDDRKMENRNKKKKDKNSEDSSMNDQTERVTCTTCLFRWRKKKNKKSNGKVKKEKEMGDITSGTTSIED